MRSVATQILDDIPEDKLEAAYKIWVDAYWHRDNPKTRREFEHHFAKWLEEDNDGTFADSVKQSERADDWESILSAWDAVVDALKFEGREVWMSNKK